MTRNKPTRAAVGAIVADLVPQCRRELAAVYPPLRDEFVANLLFEYALNDDAHVYGVDGEPIALLAFFPLVLAENTLGTWMVHTKQFGKIYRPLSRFVKQTLISEMESKGVRRVETRSLATNTDAHRWFKTLGATEETLLPGFGRNGEDFKLFSWTAAHVR